jgi:hypothetical protein
VLNSRRDFCKGFVALLPATKALGAVSGRAGDGVPGPAERAAKVTNAGLDALSVKNHRGNVTLKSGGYGQTSRLLIGWAEIDTTPDGKVDLSGQYYHRVSKGIHSRLSATALALESADKEQAVMVSLDLAGFESAFQKELRSMLRGALPDLDVSKVILNAIHTHSAPAVDPVEAIGWLAELPDVMPVSDYRRFLLERIKSVVVEAWRNRKVGGIGHALSSARVGHCRRAVYAGGSAEMYGLTNRDDFVGMESGEDSGVDSVFTFDEGRKPTGVILNLACPSQVMESTYLISSDFMGEIRQLLKQRFGESFRTLGQISAAGCQSPRDLTRNYRGEPDFWHADGVTEIGRRLLAAAECAFPHAAANIDDSPLMRRRGEIISLPRRRASYQEYLEATKQLSQLEAVMSEEDAFRDFCKEVERNEKIPGHPGPYDSKLHHFVLIQNNKAVVARYHDQDKRPAYEMELLAVRLGNIVFVTNPFELFLDFGHQIKARSAAEQTFIVQLCGGSGGYVPTACAEQHGGYGGLIINGQIGSDGGKLLVDTTVKTIAALWS